MKRTIYRDRKSGRFVEKSTWVRSKAQGGSRYVRQSIEVEKPKEPTTAEQYDQYYDDFDAYEDQGEYDTSPGYGEE